MGSFSYVISISPKPHQLLFKINLLITIKISSLLLFPLSKGCFANHYFQLSELNLAVFIPRNFINHYHSKR